ncbi:hypothetical protein GCM10020331_063240 [Ectobacillus funiculus]
MKKIIEIAKKTRAEAIHPGYGLLSENPILAERCEEEGIVFIGPAADVIAQMGSKIESRKTMIQAGVPVVPGIVAPIPTAEEAKEIAKIDRVSPDAKGICRRGRDWNAGCRQ